MSEYLKTKIGFALALLGVLFTVHPIVENYAQIGPQIGSIKFELIYFYYVFAGLLSISVYGYAIDFLRDRTISVAQKIGNTVYGIAIFIPPLYVFLFLIYWVSLGVGLLFESDKFDSAFTGFLGIVLGVATSLLAQKLITTLNERDKESEIQSLDRREYEYLEQAEKMIEIGFFNQAIPLLYSAIEAALQRLFLKKNKSGVRRNLSNLLQIAISEHLIESSTYASIRKIVDLRHVIVHNHESKPNISKEEALDFLSKANNAIKEINNIELEA